jgi:hypothetical protein
MEPADGVEACGDPVFRTVGAPADLPGILGQQNIPDLGWIG